MSVPRDRQVLIASNALDLTRTEGPSSIYNLAARILSHGKVIKNVRLGGGPHSLKVYMIFFYSCPCCGFYFVDPPLSSSSSSSSTTTTTTTSVYPSVPFVSALLLSFFTESVLCFFLFVLWGIPSEAQFQVFIIICAFILQTRVQRQLNLCCVSRLARSNGAIPVFKWPYARTRAGHQSPILLFLLFLAKYKCQVMW